MPILQNIAAIAKGMSITFREMFQPTTVENYPDGPGPLRGASPAEAVGSVPTSGPACSPGELKHETENSATVAMSPGLVPLA